MEAFESRQDGTPGKYRRPESSLSGNTRLTPQSSNSSSANLPQRLHTARSDRDRGKGQEGGGGSLLQEKLREMKASRLNDRRPSLDLESLHGIRAAQSSPMTHGSNRLPRDRETLRPGSSGKMAGERPAGKKGMGVKEMEETVSTLHKQNFDLKLELFHRRQRQTELEERLEAAEAQLAQQSEMQGVNEQLLAELEKRDQAVEEAVGIICALEEKVASLMEDRGFVTPFESRYQSSYLRTVHDGNANQDPSSSPPQFSGFSGVHGQSNQRGLDVRAVPRMPSFLSEKSEGTEALRSLYLSPDPQGPAVVGLPKHVELPGHNQPSEGDVMDSPRLSVLSESSFLSVYGEKNLILDGLDLEDGNLPSSPTDRRYRKNESVEKWVDERLDPTVTPHRPSAKRGSGFGAKQFLSINDVLESPLQRLEKLERTLIKKNNRLTSARLLHESATTEHRRASEKHEKEGKRDTLRRTDVPAFRDPEALPPTPDTISTSTLRHFKNSNEDLNRTTSDTERGRPFADRVPSSSLYQDSMKARPHSAGETVTSRREGHGWDTVTQSEYTDAASEIDVEVGSNLDPWIAMGKEKSRPNHLLPPDLFTFEGDDDEWGRDLMFDSEKRSRPQKRAERSPKTRSNNAVTPTSPNDRTLSSNDRSSSSADQSSFQSTPPIHALAQPLPPARRSSLAASPSRPTSKSYEKRASRQPRPPAAPSAAYNTTAPRSFSANAISPEQEKDTKRSRITSKIFGIGFGGSQSSPPIGYNRSSSYNGPLPPLSGHRSAGHRSVDISFEDRESASATPPPISRYPRGSGRPAREIVEVKRPITRDGINTKVPEKPRGNGGARAISSANGERNWVANGMEGYGLGLDGSGGHREGDASGQAQTQTQTQNTGRKWFSLGRNNSLKR